MKRFVFALAVAVLALPGTAAAKELKSLTVCGAHGCREVGGGQPQRFMGIFMDPPDQPGGRTGTIARVASVSEPIRLRPYYKVELTMGGDGARTFKAVYWYIRPNLFRPSGEYGALVDPFRRISAPFVRDIERVAAQLQPYSRPRVMSASVDGTRITRPSALNDLFSGHAATRAEADAGGRGVTLTLLPDRRNPWFAAATPVTYLPDSQIALLDNPVVVGDGAADQIAADGGFATRSAEAREWARPVGIGIGGLFALCVLAVLVVRARKPGTATA